MENPKGYSFSFSPRLLLLLGDQLIKDDTIALTELVKNSYDADADLVKITFKSIDQGQLGQIIIEDNGHGMNKDIIKDVWLKPGTDFKKKKFDKKELTKKYKRLPLGEKGVGRLGAHKVGSIIEITSKTESDDEIYMNIDWNKFELVNDLNDVKIEIEERKVAKHFISLKTGTKIVITGLKNDWNEKKFKEVYLQLIGLQNPFKVKDNKNKFELKISIDKTEWLENLLDIDDLKDFKLYDFYCKIVNNKIEKFEYKFQPWDTLDKVNGRIITENDLSEEDLLIKDPHSKKKKYIQLENDKIGVVEFKGSIFDRENKLLSKYPKQIVKKQCLELLDEIYGIRVFRDGLRVYNYGEKGEDWLNLDLRRVNQPTMKISNNLILGSVELDRKYSVGLIEKTNREGFIENIYFEIFKLSLLYCIGLIERKRIEDKERLRTIYVDSKPKNNIEDSFTKIKNNIIEKVKDPKDQEELIKTVNSINKDFTNIKESLLKGASNGLSLSIVIHEIEKINKEIEKVIEIEKPSFKLTQLFNHLKDIIKNYTQIIKGKDRKSETIPSLIRQALFNINFRLESHKIEIINKCTNNNTEIKIVKSLILGTILNLFDNSIFWLEYQGGKNKKIYLDIHEEKNYISLLIADNGPGFNMEFETAIKPFISGKPNDSGMGIGLHLAEQVMISHGGFIEFSDSNFDLPEDFNTGAKILLKFKK